MSEYLETGFEPMDREHAALVGRLGALLSAVSEADRSRVRTALDDFLREVGAHFAHEERLMAQNGYGLLPQHRSAHDLFLADVGENLAELEANGLTPAFCSWATGRVAEWFRFHVLANDVLLGAFLAGRRARSQLRDEPASARRRAET